MSGTRKLVIFGGGEIATLARFYFTHDSDFDVAAYVVDDNQVASDQLDGLPLVGFGTALRRYPPGEYAMFVALSYRRLNRNRQEKFEMARQAGYELPSYVCSKSVTWPDLTVGANCLILENQTIQPGVVIGDNVMVWSGNHLGHGCRLADHVYLASHVVLSGHCEIGQRSFLGVNATVRDFAKVGEDSFIAMDASVTGDVPAGSVVLGAQGTVFTPDTRQARMLKKKYFGLD